MPPIWHLAYASCSDENGTWKAIMKFYSFFVALLLISNAAVGADLRVANLLLSPEQKPNIEVLFESPVDGVVSLVAPEGWRIVPETITAVTNQKRFVFTVAQGKPNETNVYPISVVVRHSDGTTLHHTQKVHVATAPNSNLEVAGPNDQGVAAGNWGHAIPYSVDLKNNRIHIHAVWNRRHLSLLVGIDDMNLIPAEKDSPFTAVQIALGSVRSDKTFGELHQFLLFADETGTGRFIALQDNQGDSPQNMPNVDASQIFVWQHEKTVWFEAAIPFAAIPAIRPGEGRELTLSFLVHEAENKTVLDWGRNCLLPNENLEKWFRWKGNYIGNAELAVPRSEWGLCSSKF